MTEIGGCHADSPALRTVGGRETPYGAAEVCKAVGVRPETFDGWLLRRSLPLLAPGPGAGRYSLLDAVRVSAAADLARKGIAIEVGGNVVGQIGDSHIDPEADRRWAMILASSPILASLPPRKEVEEHPAVWVGPYPKEMKDLDEVLENRFAGGRPASFVMLDVTAIANTTRAKLEASATAA